MDLESVETTRRYPLTLQLAPMIDIFVLIIVFLLKSTIVADVPIIFPNQMHPPLSITKQALETYPEVVVTDTELIMGMLQETLKLNEMEKITEDRISELKSKVESYIKSKDDKIRDQSVHINLITNRENNYKNVYSSVKLLRRIGFQSVAFIAEGEGK